MILLRERNAILQSLSAGLVPGIGLQHLQVGRKNEVESLLHNLDAVRDGGSTCRFVIGEYGSGKTFLLRLLRAVALEKKFVVVQADITPDRRLYSTNHHARNLYRELMTNLATRSNPDGGGLRSLLELWIQNVVDDVRKNGGTEKDVPREISLRLKPLLDLSSGFDFVHVLNQYFQGFLQNDDGLQDRALRWIRGEYSTRTEAREQLGVRAIIDDGGYYDFLKLFARFVHIAGWSGLLVNIDELAVLSERLNSPAARNQNFEVILRILNDCLQGMAGHIGFVFAGTPDCLQNTRRGLFSYAALRSRLESRSAFATGFVDYSHPVLQLPRMSREECLQLLRNIVNVHTAHQSAKLQFPDDAIKAHIVRSEQQLGANCFQTVRDIVKEFVTMLRVLEQNPGMSWQNLFEQRSERASAESDGSSDGLKSFRL